MEGVHKLWVMSGLLMHSIHTQASDLGVCYSQAVDSKIFTPIIRNLTTRIQGHFNSFHIFTMSYPQVVHKVWVNYMHVIHMQFGVISGMSHFPKFKTQCSRKFQVGTRFSESLLREIF